MRLVVFAFSAASGDAMRREVTMDEIGVGVLGPGWVAGEHIRSYGKIPGCRVVGLCSRTEEGARAKAIESGVAGARIYTGFDEMLADPAVHAVSICTPPNQHPGQRSEEHTSELQSRPH